MLLWGICNSGYLLTGRLGDRSLDVCLAKILNSTCLSLYEPKAVHVDSGGKQNNQFAEMSPDI